MLFDVEDGTAKPTATSYASVADADDYVSITKNVVAWAALTTQEKEIYLMYASRFMDQTVSYKGSRTSATSGLRWPRYYACDIDGMTYSDKELPLPVRDTAIELAVYFAANANIVPFGPKGEQEDLKSLRVDVIALTWKDNSVSATESNKYPSFIRATLRGLGTLRYGATAGSAFKPICNSGGC